LAEQAGGKSSDGSIDTLDIEPTELHQRVPFYCGNKEMVDTLEAYLNS